MGCARGQDDRELAMEMRASAPGGVRVCVCQECLCLGRTTASCAIVCMHTQCSCSSPSSPMRSSDAAERLASHLSMQDSLFGCRQHVKWSRHHVDV